MRIKYCWWECHYNQVGWFISTIWFAPIAAAGLLIVAQDQLLCADFIADDQTLIVQPTHLVESCGPFRHRNTGISVQRLLNRRDDANKAKLETLANRPGMLPADCVAVSGLFSAFWTECDAAIFHDRKRQIRQGRRTISTHQWKVHNLDK